MHSKSSHLSPPEWRWHFASALSQSAEDCDHRDATGSSKPSGGENHHASERWEIWIVQEVFFLLLTFSFTWQESTCSRSRRYSRRHWQQPGDSWEISEMFYELRALFESSYCKHEALHHGWKRILLISSNRYPGQGASSSAVAFIRVGIWRNRRKWKTVWDFSYLHRSWRTCIAWPRQGNLTVYLRRDLANYLPIDKHISRKHFKVKFICIST